MKKPAKKNTAKNARKQRKKQLKSVNAPQKIAAGAQKTSQQAQGKAAAQGKATAQSKASPKAPALAKVNTGEPSIAPAQPSTLPVQEKKASPNRAAFFCFIAIFACMLVLESTRFKLYLDGESGEYPFLRPVGEYISLVAQKSGVHAAMEKFGQWTQALSQEFLVVADVDMASQWQSAKSFYGQALGLVAEPHKTAESALPEGDAQEQATASAKEQASPSKSPKTESSVAESSATDSGTSQKFESAPESAPESASEPVKIVPSKSYAYYDASRISPAPTEHSLEQYLTKLPDYGKKIKVLLIGDSMMMEGLGPTLQKSLRKRADVEVIREGRYSSGLSKPDFFNWPENLKMLLQKHDPHVLIISLGANDTQDIMVGKKRFQIDTEGWEKVYAIRVLNFLEQSTENNRQVLWVSLPVMSLMPYANRTKLINGITAQMAAFYPSVDYKNIEHLLTKNGKFTSFIQGDNNKTIRLRSKDKIHVSTAGGQILTDYILPYAYERVERVRMQHVEENPYIPVAGKANIMRFSSALRQKEVEYVVYLPEPVTDAVSVEKKAEEAPAAIVAVQPTSKKQELTTVPALLKRSLQNSGQGENTAPPSFPVLYILHGATSNVHEWNAYMGKDLQAIANEKRVIIVAPSGDELGWYVNSSKVAHSQIESFMVQELVPQVDILFPTNGKRGVAGFSMGGHGALSLGFKYPKLFHSIASVSGVVDIRSHTDRWQLSQLLGEYEQHKAAWDKNSALYLMEKSKKNAWPRHIVLSIGKQDTLLLQDHYKAKEVLEKKKIAFEYTELEGAHSWDFWQQEIPRQLRKQADFLYKK